VHVVVEGFRSSGGLLMPEKGCALRSAYAPRFLDSLSKTQPWHTMRWPMWARA
jgi:hypothetical protein